MRLADSTRNPNAKEKRRRLEPAAPWLIDSKISLR
jgi:hypothetical protein